MNVKSLLWNNFINDLSGFCVANSYTSPITTLDSVTGKYIASFNPSNFTNYAVGDFVIPFEARNTEYSNDEAYVCWNDANDFIVVTNCAHVYNVKAMIVKKKSKFS